MILIFPVGLLEDGTAFVQKFTVVIFLRTTIIPKYQTQYYKRFNSFFTEVPIIKKPFNWFGQQIDVLVSLW